MPLKKKQILFFDNACIHHSKIVKEYLLNNKIKYFFNVPYTPEYNPIEFIFSKLKRFIKNNYLNNNSLINLKNNVINSFKIINENDLINCYNYSFNKLIKQY